MKNAFYVKNVPTWERLLRVVGSLGVSIYALMMLSAPWSFVVAGSSVALAATGLVGWCPMCAMVGRRLDERL